MEISCPWPVVQAKYDKNGLDNLNLFLNGLADDVIVCLSLCGGDVPDIGGDALKKSLNVIANRPGAVCYLGDVDLNDFNVLTGKFRHCQFVFRKEAINGYKFSELYSFLLYLCRMETVRIGLCLFNGWLEYQVKYDRLFNYVDGTVGVKDISFGIVIPTKDVSRVEKINAVQEFKEKTTLLVENKNIGYKADYHVKGYAGGFNYSRIHNQYFLDKAVNDRYCILMNDDIECCGEQTIFELLIPFLYNTKIAVVGAKLYFPNRTIQHQGVYIDNKRLTAYHPNRGMVDSHTTNYFNTECCVTFALVAIDVNKYLEIGGMDENLPYDFNDIDYCLRCKEMGWTVLYNPQAVAVHRESETRKVDGRCGVKEDILYFKEKHKGLYR